MKKVILHSGGQGCHGVLEDVYRLVSTEADGGIEWKYPLSNLLRSLNQSWSVTGKHCGKDRGKSEKKNESPLLCRWKAIHVPMKGDSSAHEAPFIFPFTGPM
jgi:hypothetical protein